MNLPTFVTTAALGLMLAPAFAASAPPAKAEKPAPPEATVRHFIDSFNKGDLKAAAATHTADAVIIDEMPPHVWRGPNAFQAWTGDLQKASQAAGQTDERVTLGPAVRSDVNGETAYAVVKATFSFKQKGKSMSEPAEMVAALRREGGGWKIAGWAWSGGAPHPSAAKPKH
ncbi:nuclear transport factor 2 family protein [Phenylobacterium soli]|uniref:SnoaL-like domain-containing protein n=1 Tax=Phenylobacterium soli TaxID=2170551 RepID=A0A328AG81_9CAUL|nr:nuclear transport factor 2 family protein [Phenylobacterium soli]RAK53527.1 hypothetical protein DJ017_02780 [Phenylobacterium soli]